MEYPSRNDLQRLWKKLMSIAIYRGLPIADAEDIVSDTFRSAFESYEQKKGEFDTYCSTILHNRIINYWRDRKKCESFEEDYHAVDAYTPLDILEREEKYEAMGVMIKKLAGTLNDKERRFLAEYVDALDRLGKRAVSEAARKAEISVTEGHNVFRKIRRRAEVLYPEDSHQKILLTGEQDVCYQIGLSDRIEAGFENFYRVFSENIRNGGNILSRAEDY
jgi:DNA-directed RNA polymerase specialized sigma24 family protein